jgi:hypothetical protein
VDGIYAPYLKPKPISTLKLFIGAVPRWYSPKTVVEQAAFYEEERSGIVRDVVAWIKGNGCQATISPFVNGPGSSAAHAKVGKL